MRTLQAREIRLALITAGVIVVAVSYTILRNQIQNLGELNRKELRAKVERLRQTQLLAQRPELIVKLESIKGQLPRHPEGQDLKSEFARQVQTLANQSGLRLTGLTPDQESYFEDLKLYQSSVRCSWSGSSENLVSFLHLLNQQGAVADIRELRLRNRSGTSTTLSGTFVLDFVYSRIPVSEVKLEIDSPPESANSTPSP
jgi:hypothetical protein